MGTVVFPIVTSPFSMFAHTQKFAPVKRGHCLNTENTPVGSFAIAVETSANDATSATASTKVFLIIAFFRVIGRRYADPAASSCNASAETTRQPIVLKGVFLTCRQ